MTGLEVAAAILGIALVVLQIVRELLAIRRDADSEKPNDG